ncbi:cytochrome c biogenesis protein CcdA [Nitrosopumilus sp.]|uniref:redoxin domain-containing protein n=1 Tax=Nitrosopumilus sp. TaxID=2024843 RepID=UPI0034A082A9
MKYKHCLQNAYSVKTNNISKVLFASLFLFFLFAISQPVFAETIQYQATDTEGTVVNISDYKGKAVMLNGWATWCTECKKEMPYLESLYQEFSADGFTVIGVSTDNKFSDDKVLAFAEQLGVTYTIWRDPDDRFTPTFRAIGLPHTVLFDRDGNVVQVWKGAFDPLSDETKYYVNIALGNIKEDSKQEQIQTVSLVVAFAAGLLSFLSPCVLPLVPVYATFISGLNIKESTAENNVVSGKTTLNQYKTITNGILFVTGFSLVFIILGTSVAYVSSFFTDSSFWIEKIGGVVVIVFGLHIAGLLKIPRLERQMKFNVMQKGKRVGPLIVGMSFGAGWTPCIGPILATILTLAASSSSAITGTTLLLVYSLGLAIPFIICAVAIDRVMFILKKLQKRMNLIEKISGGLLIGVGILLLSGSFSILNSAFSKDITTSIIQNDL